MHTTMPKVSRLEVIATGSRRRWTPEEKQRILAESYEAPRRVSATARRHGLSTGQLFTWRREARSARLVNDDAAAFAQVVVAPARDTPPMASRQTGSIKHGRIEIVLQTGHRVLVGTDVDRAALTRVLDALERRS
jgi:transposase